MKNFLITGLAIVCMVSCTTEDLQTDDSQLTPLENLVDEVSGTTDSKAPGGTKRNPIVVRVGKAIPKLEFGKYYRIYGELVTLTSVPKMSGSSPNFLYREVPNSKKIQRVEFKKDKSGVSYIGKKIDYPFATFNCNTLESNNGRFKGKRYVVRDENNSVWEKFVINPYTTGLRFAGKCGNRYTPAPAIVCKGVPAWKSGRRYKAGDTVVYNYRLFIRLPDGWQQIGECPF